MKYLSGGEKQRVAIARALINKPNIILADEPTGSLDTVNTTEIYDILRNLNDEGKTIIYISHDLEFAKKAKHIIKLSDGEIVAL